MTIKLFLSNITLFLIDLSLPYCLIDISTNTPSFTHQHPKLYQHPKLFLEYGSSFLMIWFILQVSHSWKAKNFLSWLLSTILLSLVDFCQFISRSSQIHLRKKLQSLNFLHFCANLSGPSFSSFSCNITIVMSVGLSASLFTRPVSLPSFSACN